MDYSEKIRWDKVSDNTNYLAEWRKEHGGQQPINVPDMPDKVSSAFHQAWAAAVRAAQDDVETQRQALEAMRREMDTEKAAMATEIEQLEQGLEEAVGKLEAAVLELENQRRGREVTEKQVTELRIENARLDERAKAAEGRADELRQQLEVLQEKFTEAFKPHDQKRERVSPREPQED